MSDAFEGDSLSPASLPMSRVTFRATSCTRVAIRIPLRKRVFAVKKKPRHVGEAMDQHIFRGRAPGEAGYERQCFFPVTAPLLTMST